MSQYLRLTSAEAEVFLKQLSQIYDAARLVDAGMMRELVCDRTGKLVATEHHCYKFWGKSGRCRNCTSAMAFREKNRQSKFEFKGHDVYYVNSQFIMVDGQSCVLEVVEKNSDTTIVNAFGRNKLVEMVKSYTDEMYTDSVTKISNRKYLDEQIIGVPMDAIAMMDIDNFKVLNDTYGHICGDKVLYELAQAIRKNVRDEDVVLRYGGDEFLIAFMAMREDCFEERLDKIRKMITEIVIKEYNISGITVSIGGAYGRNQVADTIAVADRALYDAKRTKNKVVVYSVEPAEE